MIVSVEGDWAAMNKAKRQRLEKAGWRIGSAADLLRLSPEEAAIVDLKVSLAAAVRKQRQAKKLTQSDLAHVLGSSQSRVAKIEAADSEVSIDLLVRALLVLGVTRQGLAKIVATRSAA